MEAALTVIGEDLKFVELQLRKDLESNVPLISKVGEYVLASGGKRVRPALLLLSAKICGYNGDKHIPLAGVIEFIHTATLLHDDVVDNANIRRGNASANSVWGNEASVLVGDFLFSRSFSLMVDTGSLAILEVISRATTLLAEGEVLQLICTSDVSVTEERYIEVIRNKTAVLISAACHAGALLGNCSRDRIHALRDYGMDLGIAFQLMDDTLDYIASEDSFGKSIGHDLEEGKVTLPLIHTLQNCTSAERERIVEVVTKQELEEGDFDAVFELVKSYGGIDFTIEKARQHISLAKSRLDIFPDSPEKAALIAIADYVITRER